MIQKQFQAIDSNIKEIKKNVNTGLKEVKKQIKKLNDKMESQSEMIKASHDWLNRRINYVKKKVDERLHCL